MIKELETYEQVEEFVNSDSARSLYFSTTTCVTCHTWKPVVEEYFKELDLEIASVNLMNLPKLAREMGVMGVPSLVVFRGGEEQDRFGHHQFKRELFERIKR